MPVSFANFPTVAQVDGELARRHLREFVRQAWPIIEPATPFISGWHIDCICDHLEAVTNGEIADLLINVPPRSGKSTIVSIMWPMWEWISHPSEKWVFNSYSDDLVIRDSVRCRRLIDSTWYQRNWGDRYKLASDQNVKSRFENDKAGYRYCFTVNGSNTGEGGSRIVVDDPHNVKQGESDVVRQGVITWWREVMPTRLNNYARDHRVVIMQRIHHADLSGYILSTQDSRWHHLCLPARYEAPVISYGKSDSTNARLDTVPVKDMAHKNCVVFNDLRTLEGELLSPERMSNEDIARLEIELGPYSAAGQLQQRPVPREGAYFSDEWFRPLPSDFDEPRSDKKSLRQRLTIIQYWDLAWSKLQTADYTAAITLGVDSMYNVYILNCFRERLGSSRLAEGMLEHLHLTRPSLVGVEVGAYKQAATQDVVRRVLQALKLPCAVYPIPKNVDKVAAAMLPASRAKAGLVYADRTAPWWPGLLQELLDFPVGSHDDRVDSLSGAILLAISHPMTKEENTSYKIGSGSSPESNLSWAQKAIQEQPVSILRRNGEVPGR